MIFLVGVLIFIAFCIFGYFFIRNKYRQITTKYLGTSDIKSIIEQARIEDEEVPKSLSGMDSIYLEQINKDFPDVNINELKRMAEAEILNAYHAVENKDYSNIKNEKIKSFVRSRIDDLGKLDISYDDLKIHRTVIGKYEKNKGIATIYFASSFQYVERRSDGKVKKIQDRVRCEYIYVIDIDKVENNQNVLGISCPNCGSPIKSLGVKSCSYCGSGVVDVVSKVWIINDIVRY